MGRKLIKPGLLETAKMAVPQDGGDGCDRALLSFLRINTQKSPLELTSKNLSQDA